jgi:hypothetical protein
LQTEQLPEIRRRPERVTERLCVHVQRRRSDDLALDLGNEK